MKWNFRKILDYATDLIGTIPFLIIVYWALWHCQKETIEQSTPWILHQAYELRETTREAVGKFF
ncbi:MAG: hypothetical protein PHE53_12715 [Thermoguttaceae bacterium]|nr:hypothetical protein [Thermoguttaceae bacterium]